ncbi:glycoside hydrolase family 32 protein [Cellulomonas sp. S1-8]|uniref:glycoside hydrolase family 32 protein n=1 Tax=Cellulomonas sp. S1-8 TaxID=2904790 RepID=UPI00224371DA|nr:glycoside hydrolase family 32 protein [Cellulomonas sp. S1-8]UZN02919.1 glycoside hydrolase family 32 protein [Cellulomonas sp. S1-8]
MTSAAPHDPHDPRWHVRAPRGWVNDPNGIGRWDGRWHVMYQWNPHAPVWGDIHWGHVSSTDLLRWEHEPAALTPRPGTIDGGGAWSGVAVHDAGDVALVYSAVRDTVASAGVAVARRGPAGGWVQPDRLAAPPPDLPGVVDVRDPFLLTVDGRRLGIQGAGTPDGGAVLVYDVPDLDDWRLLGTLVAAGDAPDGVAAPGRVWECPQLVQVAGTWVLLVSWFDRGDGPERLGVTAFTGRLDLAGDVPRYVVEASAPFDHGPDVYAPQVHVADDGRVLVWGWSWEGRGDGPLGRLGVEVGAAGWAGVLTFPRELVPGPRGLPVARPAAELAGLRDRPLPVAGDGDRAELVTDEVAWWARSDAGLEVALVDDDVAPVVVWTGRAEAEVLVDGSVLEAFEADRGSTTTRVYRRGGQRWRVRSRGSFEATTLGLPDACPTARTGTQVVAEA